MAAAAPQRRAGVSFEVERLDRVDDRLVVTGHWTGVRGLRFVRPTLVIGHRRLHATLEHKPWAPTLGEPWTAAFPWTDGEDVDASSLELAVAPSVSVRLDGRDDEEEAVAEQPAAPEPPAPPPAPPLPAREASGAGATMTSMRNAQLESEMAELAEAHDALREQLAERDARLEQLERRMELERRAASEAIAERDELARARTAAVRTRARMERQHDDERKARQAAEAKLAQAAVDRDEVRAQRDETVVAFRTLQRRLRRDHATQELPAVDTDADVDADEPLGVRTVPAARTLMSELQRPAPPPPRFLVSKFDLWAVRVLGTVAGACFILLLIMILRVFI